MHPFFPTFYLKSELSYYNKRMGGTLTIMSKRYLLFITLIVLLAACTSPEPGTPTPFAASELQPQPAGITSVAVELTELAANPDTFIGAQLIVSGQFTPLPRLVCSGQVYRSPATWQLGVGEVRALMSGFREPLQTLLPENVEVTVAGVWRTWEGPVGCGKEATVQQLHYLEIREIVSPNPIAQVTGDAAANPTATGAEGIPEPPAENGGETTPTAEQPEQTPTAAETAVSTPTGGAPLTPTATNAFNTPTPSATTTGTPDDDSGADGTSTPTATAGGPTATATATSDGTAVPTATSNGSGGNPTAAPTSPSLATPTQPPDEVSAGTIAPGQLGFELVGDQQIHAWNVSLGLGDVITVSVAGQPGKDMVISLVDPNGQTLVDSQNSAGSGSIERLNNFTINTDGAHKLLVRTADNTAADYVLTIYDDASFPFIFQDIMEYGDSASGVSLTADSDDYWLFYGEVGDNITLSVDPTGSDTDLFLTLWNSTGDVDDSDETDLGATETINYTIASDGMYALQVADWDFLPRGYAISLTQN